MAEFKPAPVDWLVLCGANVPKLVQPTLIYNIFYSSSLPFCYIDVLRCGLWRLNKLFDAGQPWLR
jgi:hypothetical protein